MLFSDYIKTPKDRFDYFLMEYDTEIVGIITDSLNTKIDIKVTHFANYAFSTEFFIDKNKYEVLFFRNTNEIKNFVISFVRNDDYNTTKVSSKEYQGKVFAGVFGSVDMFLKKFKVDKIAINALKNNNHLIRFYDSRFFKSIFYKRNLNFIERNSTTDMISWVYEYDKDLQSKIK